MLSKILLVGDPHSSPDTDNRRFDWLGRIILEENPNLVICIGDFADLNSLSSYDRGKKSAELRRYRHDIRACHDALERINRPLKDFNTNKKLQKKSIRKPPKKIMLHGNHEARIARAVNLAPELEGTLDIADLAYTKYGWEEYPFKRMVCIEGVYFCHYFPSGVKGDSISGFNIAANVLAKNMASSVCGHSHLYDHAIRKKPDGTTTVGLNCGWYGEETTYEDATESLWWSGLIILHEVHGGSFDVEQLSMARIKALYS